jgi:Ni/Fe-hydrogenase subunit HybB-like protein
MKIASLHDAIENRDVWVVVIADMLYMRGGSMVGAIMWARWQHFRRQHWSKRMADIATLVALTLVMGALVVILTEYLWLELGMADGGVLQ